MHPPTHHHHNKSYKSHKSHKSYKSHKTLSLWFMLVASVFLSASLPAASEETRKWKIIGSTYVLPSSEAAVIQIHKSAEGTVWRSLKLNITNGDLKVRDVKLLMSDQQTVKLDIQKLIKPGLNSRELTVPARGRTIKKVTVYYQLPGDHSADIRLMASEHNYIEE